MKPQACWLSFLVRGLFRRAWENVVVVFGWGLFVGGGGRGLEVVLVQVVFQVGTYTYT